MKKSVKPLLSLFLACLIATGVCTGCSQTPPPPSSAAPSSTTTASQPSGELVIGSTTELTGRFFSSLWGNNSSDMRIRSLINGTLDTVVYQKELGAYGYNTRVCPDVTETVGDDGSKTFTFTLATDMLYSDGTPIQAADYVFSILFGSNAALAQVGAAEPNAGIYYVGYQGYRDGSAPAFSGVRLLDTHRFSVQIASENLPHYYDLAYAGISPYPVAVLAPGCTVKDTGSGAYIDGPFTAELLGETVTNADSGYLYAPKVVAGPYLLESFDAGSKIAVLKANPNYFGDYNGQKPRIEKLIFKTTQGATQIDELASGNVGLLSGLGGADSIPPGLNLADEGKAGYVSYPRSGFGYIGFHCNVGPTQFAAVRQAIAYLLDVPEFARTYSGGYATVVYGWYGSAQWMAQENAAKIKDEFNPYDLNLDKAKSLLVADGWTLNAQGGSFVEGTDTLRYKLVDGTLMPLEIQWAQEADNPVSTLLAQMLPGNMAQVGMKLTAEVVDFSVIADNYYGMVVDKDGNRAQKYNMYNLAANFSPLFEPRYTFSSDETYLGRYNSFFLQDEALSTLAADLNLTPNTDRAGYSDKWYALQKRFNELVPAIPLYSDTYYDFFTPKLKGYETDSFWSLQSAILYAWLET